MQQVSQLVCECCDAEVERGADGWSQTMHGDFCPDCTASLRAETERLIAALPTRIALCPQCAPEFYYPLQEGEGLLCPTPDCGMTMIVYEMEARHGAPSLDARCRPVTIEF